MPLSERHRMVRSHVFCSPPPPSVLTVIVEASGVSQLLLKHHLFCLVVA
jgi:hypothetical protein